MKDNDIIYSFIIITNYYTNYGSIDFSINFCNNIYNFIEKNEKFL